MSDSSLPLYLVVADASRREALAGSLEGLDPEVRGDGQPLDPGTDPPGVVVLDPSLPPEEILSVLRTLPPGDSPWIPVWVEEDSGGELRGRAVSLGSVGPVEELVARARGEGESPVLELGVVLRRVARARHDINNPLTAAMAETQLLLMDVQEEEIREPLETVQRQLRRIQDLVGNLTALRWS